MILPRGAGAVFLTCAVVWVVTFLAHGWVSWAFLVVSILITYFVLGNWIYCHASPWRRIYFPMIDRYSRLAGAHSALAEVSGQSFTPRGPVAALLKQIQPPRAKEHDVSRPDGHALPSCTRLHGVHADGLAKLEVFHSLMAGNVEHHTATYQAAHVVNARPVETVARHFLHGATVPQPPPRPYVSERIDVRTGVRAHLNALQSDRMRFVER